MKKFCAHLKGNTCIFIVAVLVGIWYSANSVLIPIISGQLITAVVNDLSGVTGFILPYLGIYFAQLILCHMDTFMTGQFKIRQRMTMRNRAYEAYSYRNAADREGIASFVSYLNNDLPAVVEQYFAGTIDISKCVCLILFSAVSILSVHWILALEILIFSIMIVCFPTLLKGKGDRARKAVSVATSVYNGRLQSFLGGMPVLKSYGYRKRSACFMKESNQEIAEKESKQLQCQITVYGTTSFLQLSKDGLLLLTSVVLASRGIIDIGSLVTVLQLASLLAAPIEMLAYLRHARNEVGSLLSRYEEALKGFQNYREISAGKSIKSDRVNTENVENAEIAGIAKNPYLELNDRGIEKKQCKFRTLSVKNLSFDYNGVSILKNINHTFRAGEKYLITGESGSGKSTLMRCLSRIVDFPTDKAACMQDGENYRNRIFFNETDADKLPNSLYYKYICPVFQEPYLFYASLRENILLGRNIPEQVYWETIEKLHLNYLLKRYERLEISPQIVEQLSGGEKQRIALARAMVGRPDAYLCDEVTSALDEENAENVERILLEEDAMVIMISHKPSARNLERYTEHLIMEKGCLREVRHGGKNGLDHRPAVGN